MQYRLVRSNRRTMAIEIRNGEVIVRTPWRTTQREIDGMLQEKRAWIETHLQKSMERKKAAAKIQPLTSDELKELGQKAVEYLPGRVRHYAALLGVQPRKITVRNQRTRWGSCSSGGNLNFNCLLMLTPPEVIDSVVVHELCHRKHMDHSKEFYDEVLRVFPDYRKWDKYLKDAASSPSGPPY